MNNSLIRFNISIQGNDFVIHDSISGNVTSFESGIYKCFGLDRNIIVQHLQQLQTAMMSAKHKKCYRQPSDILSNGPTVTIRQDGQESWTIGIFGNSAKLCNGALLYKKGFNADTVMSFINRTLCTLLQADKILQPKVDIVRRIPDARLVVWTYGSHSTVCYEEGINGATMSNCLIDGNYYDLVLVQSDEESKACTLLTTNFDIIVEYPLDDSIKFFYGDDGGKIE